jgi:hypothetical protein
LADLLFDFPTSSFGRFLSSTFGAGNLAEIQEAIEKLSPEERAALREWLEESDPDAMVVIRERVTQIRAGEATLIDGNQVQEEMR